MHFEAHFLIKNSFIKKTCITSTYSFCNLGTICDAALVLGILLALIFVPNSSFKPLKTLNLQTYYEICREKFYLQKFIKFAGPILSILGCKSGTRNPVTVTEASVKVKKWDPGPPPQSIKVGPDMLLKR